jgi:hypothetical protein
LFYPIKSMNKCHNCFNPITEHQIICLNCGCQIKPLEIKLRFFGARRRHLVLIQHPPLAGKNLIRWKYREPNVKLKAPKGNLTLDNWF